MGTTIKISNQLTLKENICAFLDKCTDKEIVEDAASGICVGFDEKETALSICFEGNGTLSGQVGILDQLYIDANTESVDTTPEYRRSALKEMITKIGDGGLPSVLAFTAEGSNMDIDCAYSFHEFKEDLLKEVGCQEHKPFSRTTHATKQDALDYYAGAINRGDAPPHILESIKELDAPTHSVAVENKNGLFQACPNTPDSQFDWAWRVYSSDMRISVLCVLPEASLSEPALHRLDDVLKTHWSLRTAYARQGLYAEELIADHQPSVALSALSSIISDPDSKVLSSMPSNKLNGAPWAVRLGIAREGCHLGKLALDKHAAVAMEALSHPEFEIAMVDAAMLNIAICRGNLASAEVKEKLLELRADAEQTCAVSDMAM